MRARMQPVGALRPASARELSDERESYARTHARVYCLMIKHNCFSFIRLAYIPSYT